MLTKDSTGLIVIDIQGKLARLVHESEIIIANCRKLIQGAQALSLPILWLEQYPEKLGATVDEIRPLLKELRPIPKFTFNACEEPLFLEEIKKTGVDTWLVCGIESHICVYQTALHLKQTGYTVQLVSDCTSSRTLANKHLAIQRLSQEGVQVTAVEMCLYELVKDCRSVEFKEILGLIK